MGKTQRSSCGPIVRPELLRGRLRAKGKRVDGRATGSRTRQCLSPLRQGG